MLCGPNGRREEMIPTKVSQWYQIQTPVVLSKVRKIQYCNAAFIMRGPDRFCVFKSNSVIKMGYFCLFGSISNEKRIVL